jgi:hypothetical protein
VALLLHKAEHGGGGNLTRQYAERLHKIRSDNANFISYYCIQH